MPGVNRQGQAHIVSTAILSPRSRKALSLLIVAESFAVRQSETKAFEFKKEESQLCIITIDQPAGLARENIM
jgi:hypothetical protein